MRSLDVRHSLTLWCAASLLAGLTTAAGAQVPGGGRMPMGGPGPMPPPPGPGGPGWLGAVMRLDLTEQQRSGITSILDEQREAGRETRDQLREVQQQLGAAVFTASPDDGSVASLMEQLADLQKQALQADIGVQQQVNALLTDTQRQQLLKFLSQVGPPRGARQ